MVDSIAEVEKLSCSGGHNLHCFIHNIYFNESLLSLQQGVGTAFNCFVYIIEDPTAGKG